MIVKNNNIIINLIVLYRTCYFKLSLIKIFTDVNLYNKMKMKKIIK